MSDKRLPYRRDRGAPGDWEPYLRPPSLGAIAVEALLALIKDWWRRRKRGKLK